MTLEPTEYWPWQLTLGPGAGPWCDDLPLILHLEPLGSEIRLSAQEAATMDEALARGPVRLGRPGPWHESREGAAEFRRCGRELSVTGLSPLYGTLITAPTHQFSAREHQALTSTLQREGLSLMRASATFQAELAALTEEALTRGQAVGTWAALVARAPAGEAREVAARLYPGAAPWPGQRDPARPAGQRWPVGRPGAPVWITSRREAPRRIWSQPRAQPVRWQLGDPAWLSPEARRWANETARRQTLLLQGPAFAAHLLAPPHL